MNCSKDVSKIVLSIVVDKVKQRSFFKVLIVLKYCEAEFYNLFKENSRFLVGLPSFKSLWLRFFFQRFSAFVVITLLVLAPSIDRRLHDQPTDFTVDFILVGFVFLITLARFVFSFQRQIGLIIDYSIKYSLHNGMPSSACELLVKRLSVESFFKDPLKRIGDEICKEVCRKSNQNYDEMLLFMDELFQKRFASINIDTRKVSKILSSVRARRKYFLKVWFVLILIPSFTLLPDIFRHDWRLALLVFIKVCTFISLPFLWMYFRPRAWIISSLIKRANKVLRKKY